MNLFDVVNSDEFDGIVRHLLTVAGGAGLVTGNLDPSQWQTIAGAVTTVLTILWSVASKKYVRKQALLTAPSAAPALPPAPPTQGTQP